jgi:hypothetical protein
MSQTFRTQMSFGKDIQTFFVQLETGQLVMGFEIVESSPRTFDKHRPPVVIMDEGVAIDFGASKDIHDVTVAAEILSIHYVFDPRLITTVIWHGQGKERKGNIGSLISTKSLTLKVYYSDYTYDDFALDANSIAALQKRLIDGLGL